MAMPRFRPTLGTPFRGGGAFVDTPPVTIYANGSLNNFVFSDVDAATNATPDYEFAYINDSTNGIFQVVAANFLQSDSFSTADGNPRSWRSMPRRRLSWKLTEVAPVPVPAALPLLMSGLGLLGFSAAAAPAEQISSHLSSHSFRETTEHAIQLQDSAPLGGCGRGRQHPGAELHLRLRRRLHRQGRGRRRLFTPPVFADTAAASSASSTAASVYAGATVCFDLNGNGACDPGEPSRPPRPRAASSCPARPWRRWWPRSAPAPPTTAIRSPAATCSASSGTDPGRDQEPSAGRDRQHHSAVDGSRSGHREPGSDLHPGRR